MGISSSKPLPADNNLETFSAVWLDASVNTTEENIQAQEQLRAVINHVKTFEDDKNCEDYIRTISENDRIVLIASGQLGKEIVPRIQQLRQIFSIYIFCLNIKANEKWSKEYIKVQGVFSNLGILIDQIYSDQDRRKHNKVDEQISISIFNTNIPENQWISESNYDFIYSQVLIDCLRKLKMTSAEIYEVMSLCRTEYKENKNELKIISEFEKNYSPDEALKWYTRECFLYKMLSKAFRVQNIDLIFLFRFVIDHIQHQLKANKYLPSNRVYRGQLMTKEELKMLKESLGQFISINSFLSAILNENSARLFLVDQIVSDGIERVLFEIDIRNGDLAEFSDIKLKSYYTQEEILFSMGSIFQIIDIRLGKDGIQIIQMTLCSSDHPQIKPIFQYIENKYGDTKLPLLSFGKVLQKMNRFDEAEKYYRRLIKALPQNHEYIVKCQNALKTIPLDKDKHEKTLKTINESIDDLMETSKTKDFSQAFNHSHMGDNYRNMGQFDRALESYNTALQIWRKSFNDDHQEVGRCYNNIGLIYEKKEEYDAAVNYYQKALTILEKYLPANHSELGEIYFNIGHMHQYLNDDDQALVNYIKSLEIAEQTLIPQYSLVSVMNKIAFVYEQKKDFKEALIYYKKIAASLPSTHDDMVKNEQNIQRVSSQLK